MRRRIENFIRAESQEIKKNTLHNIIVLISLLVINAIAYLSFIDRLIINNG